MRDVSEKMKRVRVEPNIGDSDSSQIPIKRRMFSWRILLKNRKESEERSQLKCSVGLVSK
jgi:hypothetical protein